MHREISHTDQAFQQERNLSLYVLTGLLGLFIVLDSLPTIGGWLNLAALSSWPQGLYTYRFALIAAVVGGARVLYGSLQSLFEGRIGADLALAIACIAAILINEPLVAAEVVFIGMVGECLESFTFARTQRAIRQIVEVCPRRCWLLRDGQEVRILTSELQVGDRVVVKPGGRIPADGLVIEGRSAVDTSALTGESLPLDKGPGDEVLAGSLNQFGALTIEARRVAEHTVVGRVIELTARALKDKGNIERTADRLARYFLPVVLGLAAATFLGALLYHGTTILRPAEAARLGLRQAATLSLYPALAVLVVSCPCALILATPAAIIAALGRLAGTGILIKGGSALERLATVSVFAFDKTGTITEGKLELGDVVPLGQATIEEVLGVAASTEQRSEHLLARLIVHEAQARNLALEAVEAFLAHPGAGVTAQTATGTVVVGTRRLLEEQGIDLSAGVLAVLERFDASGQTALLVARQGTILGVIGARDRLRPETAGVLEELHGLGIADIVLLTGDRQAAAQALAGDLPFTQVHAELLPDQKAAFLVRFKEERQAKGMAMVGDGINDAPALAWADVGLAIGGTGTDIAAEAGDVVFMGQPLRPLPLLVRLSRETVRIIRQNIVIFAFGVNAVGIVLTGWLWPMFAPAGWYEQSPLAAVIYHQIGSLAVLLNSMRLLWFERAAASPTLRRTKYLLQDVDAWLERYLDLGEVVHWLEHHWRQACLGLAGLLLLTFALSGLTLIRADEVAVVKRFGRPVADLEPGLYWRWPWPIEETIRVSQRIRTVEIGFRTLPGQKAQGALAWTSAHAGDGLRRVPDEAVMITGDGDLVELLATVRYHVSAPHVFLFRIGAADDVVRSTAESVMRSTVAGRPFLELLTIHRAQFQEEVLRRLAERCRDYDLGITFDGVSLHDLHPPPEVVKAYYEVAQAMEGRDRLINEAQALAIEKVRAAEAESNLIVSRARALFTEKVMQAAGERDTFLARSRARKEPGFGQEFFLSLQAVDAVLNGAAPAQVELAYEQQRTALRSMQPLLSDFRLFWDTLSQALTGRDLVLIDADKVGGQRNLLLVDPDQFRVPFPLLLPPERMQRSPFRPSDKEEP